MSWLDDRTISYQYKMSNGSIRNLVLPTTKEAPKQYKFGDGKVGVYVGFEPEEVKQTSVIEFEQNGRKAVKIRDKDGKVRHMSKTKLKYLKTGRVENQYTDSYKAHLTKTQQEQLLKSSVGTGKGKVEEARSKALKEKIGSLPDGEYLSDGKNFMKKGV